MDTVVTMTKEQALAKGILLNKKVTLMPVPRAGAMITDKNHIGYFHFDGTQISFDLPISKSRGGLLPILNADELNFFSGLFGEDLNFNKRENNFWFTKNGKVTIIIDKNFKEKGLTLDLSEPLDNFKWRLLKVQNSVSETWEDRYARAEFRFALMDSDYQESDKLNKMGKLQKAYKFLNTLTSSRTKMYDFLCVYWMQNDKAKRPEPDASIEILAAMIQDIIDANVDSFNLIADDPNYETKLFVQRAMSAGYVDRQGVRGDFTIDGRFIGKTIDDTIRNLLSPEYHEEYLRIKALMDANEPKAVAPAPTKKVVSPVDTQTNPGIANSKPL